MKIDIKSVAVVLSMLFLGFFVGRHWIVSEMHSNHDMSMSEHSDETGDVETFVDMKNQMVSEMINNEEYKCCLEKPCTYCIEKTPGHGEGATCSCLEDIMNGVHPCGECIGEILEGHGNRLIAKYFATAISEEVGVEHTNTIKQIIASKYDVSVEEQL
ncbi:hypothetical protein ACFL2C_00645 [Patescibacteria group bacterium]